MHIAQVADFIAQEVDFSLRINDSLLCIFAPFCIHSRVLANSGLCPWILIIHEQDAPRFKSRA
jgi:hypothetical protein